LLSLITVDHLSFDLKKYISCSHVRTVVATLGGKQGAASRFDRWQYLHSGFTVWLSVSDAGGEEAFSFVCAAALVCRF
jgi:hypothetical protein